MKKNIFFCLLILITNIAVAQNIAKIDSGIVNNANYKILFPINWKGKLVMFAHGYEFVGTVSYTKKTDFIQKMTPFLEKGFAVAASDYQYQGFALPQGVDDTEALRKYFFKTYGEPDSTFMVGQSMGGGVALATMENYDKHYLGALPMCPFSSRPYLQCRQRI